MNKKIKQFAIPFILMLIFNLGSYYLTRGQYFSRGFLPHLGLLFLSGLVFGPYGAAGSSIGNLIGDFIRGHNPIISIICLFINFGISCLAYKIWYENFKWRDEVTTPQLTNTTNVLLFIGIILLSGLLDSLLHGKMFFFTLTDRPHLIFHIEARYFFNFINSSIIFGIVGLWLSRKIDFTYIPEVSKKKINKTIYKIFGALLIIIPIATLIIDYYITINSSDIIAEVELILLILFAYLTKPNTSQIKEANTESISAKIMGMFQLAILFVIIVGILISNDRTLLTIIEPLLPLNKNEIVISMLGILDAYLLIFIIPILGVMKFIEMKVIEPISSFSKIESFIKENEKIESEGLVNIYSKHINKEDEIGTLARSYTDLIKHNNHYIENIREIEGERERIETELDIARNIQAENLPIKAIETDEYIIDGFSHPAKEVGGDFFDYYNLDEDNLAIAIGDASGKGVPAAILTMNTQVMTKQLLKNEKDPSKVLQLINKELSENNYESMFITLWLGIYNKKTGKLTFSNAGHEHPLIMENDEFKILDSDNGIALGIMEDFEFKKEEIELKDELILYTDGITDAKNKDNEMYGEKRLIEFFNDFKEDEDPIRPLFDNISEFTNEEEQFDDMTLLYLKNKK